MPVSFDNVWVLLVLWSQPSLGGFQGLEIEKMRAGRGENREDGRASGAAASQAA